MSDEYEEMRGQIVADDAKRRTRTPEAVEAAVAATRGLIEKEWRGFGYEPLPNRDGSLSAPSTLRTIGRWPPPGATKTGALPKAE